MSTWPIRVEPGIEMTRRGPGSKRPAPPKRRSPAAASLRGFKPKVEDDPKGYRRRPRHPGDAHPKAGDQDDDGA